MDDQRSSTRLHTIHPELNGSSFIILLLWEWKQITLFLTYFLPRPHWLMMTLSLSETSLLMLLSPSGMYAFFLYHFLCYNVSQSRWKLSCSEIRITHHSSLHLLRKLLGQWHIYFSEADTLTDIWLKDLWQVCQLFTPDLMCDHYKQLSHFCCDAQAGLSSSTTQLPNWCNNLA